MVFVINHFRFGFINLNQHNYILHMIYGDYKLISDAMPNKVFNTVVKELDFVGDILSVGITKKAVINQGSTPDEVTVATMKRAISNHIVPSLLDFMSKKKAEDWKNQTIRKINKLEGSK